MAARPSTRWPPSEAAPRPTRSSSPSPTRSARCSSRRCARSAASAAPSRSARRRRTHAIPRWSPPPSARWARPTPSARSPRRARWSRTPTRPWPARRSRPSGGSGARRARRAAKASEDVLFEALDHADPEVVKARALGDRLRPRRARAGAPRPLPRPRLLGGAAARRRAPRPGQEPERAGPSSRALRAREGPRRARGHRRRGERAPRELRPRHRADPVGDDGEAAEPHSYPEAGADVVARSLFGADGIVLKPEEFRLLRDLFARAPACTSAPRRASPSSGASASA